MTALLFFGQGCFSGRSFFRPGVSMTDCQQYPAPFFAARKKTALSFIG